MGSFQRKKTVELKFITATPPYTLNNLETRICRKFNFGCFRASLGTRFGGTPAPIWKLLCLDRNEV